MDATLDTPHTAPAPASPAKRFNRETLLFGLALLTVMAAAAGGWYLLEQSRYVYTDKAEVQAPLIQLAPSAPGQLKHVSISEGDSVEASQAVARVGDEILHTEVAGLVVTVQKDIGAVYTPAKPVVTMIDPHELRVVAQIEEDKGLRDIEEGQDAIFTVDAYGSRQFHGTVESVSATKRQGDVVFNISDKRESKQFDVKIAYDHTAYPELRNGMSARVWIVK